MLGSRVVRPAASDPESDRPLPLLGELATLKTQSHGLCQQMVHVWVVLDDW